MRLAGLAAVLWAAGTLPAHSDPPKVLSPSRVVPLAGSLFHVQGLLVSGDRVFVTSVDRAARKGYLFECTLAAGTIVRSVELQSGDRFHPGGFDEDRDSLWIPVAEYRPGGTTQVQRRSKDTLERLASFEVPDHIGALAARGGRLFLANWDARRVLEMSSGGRILTVRSNPTPYRIQDWKFRGGMLVASGLAPKGSSEHAVVWLDPETLRVVRRIGAGVTGRGVPLTNEGLDFRGGTLFLLPEDAPSRIFVFYGLGRKYPGRPAVLRGDGP